jgi:hypothetical protein
MSRHPDLPRTGAAAMAGAVLAVTALWRTRTIDHWPVLVALVLVAAVTVPLAATALGPPTPPAPPAPPPPRPAPARAAPPAARPAPRQWYDQPAATVAVPVRPDTWWDAAPRTAPEPAQGPPDPDADPAERSVTRVVQCPACGDFAVDLRQRDAGFAFECRGCGHGWQWRPGTPWPAAVVRPRRRRPGPG